jgi:putative methyltransferase (TIGR04325 family)
LNRENTIEMREYESFESALRDSDSYEDPRLIEVVKEKTRSYKETLAGEHRPPVQTRQTVQNMFVLSYVEPNRPLNVLEVGGACGAAYYEAKSMLPRRTRHWAIVETPVMATAGESIADDPNLSFHSDIASAADRLETRDLAIAQGVLQYAGNPVQVLSDLFALGLSYVYVTRTAVADVEAPIFTRQETDLAAHGPGKLANAPNGRSSQPMTLVSLAALTSAIPANYEIVFKFEESEERTLSISDRRIAVRDIGFLASKKARGA